MLCGGFAKKDGDTDWGTYVIAGGLIAADLIFGGPTGEGIAPAMAILGAKQASKQIAIGISKKGLKHLSKHLKDFKKFDSKFSLDDQVELGKKIASNPSNLVNVRNGSQGFESVVKIGESSVRVRAVVNASGNLRSVYPVGP
ncbi:hypothetical protein [Microbulbifer sp. 2205BS26-8]|uniref:hypothetical protein n=1 Tax=Microbulbifer sp. 2205BS26-8 TaxID=3064386 RepID=UPI00273F2CD7|nr:hypothetical protein [Microbulbifer sp. 2205BS26-8]MDP5210229.1 hypothetical protein [Microbulbifer sp. 2205BS26-8]